MTENDVLDVVKISFLSVLDVCVFQKTENDVSDVVKIAILPVLDICVHSMTENDVSDAVKPANFTVFCAFVITPITDTQNDVLCTHQTYAKTNLLRLSRHKNSITQNDEQKCRK